MRRKPNLFRTTRADRKAKRQEHSQREAALDDRATYGFLAKIGAVAVPDRQPSEWRQLVNAIFMERSCMCDTCRRFRNRSQLSIRRRTSGPSSETGTYGLYCPACDPGDVVVAPLTAQ